MLLFQLLLDSEVRQNVSSIGKIMLFFATTATIKVNAE